MPKINPLKIKVVAVLVEIMERDQSSTMRLLFVHDEDWTDEIQYKMMATESLKKENPNREATYNSKGVRLFESEEEVEKYKEMIKNYTSDEISANWMNPI